MALLSRPVLRPRLTMNHVAATAGVSPTTVDRVLNGRGVVHPETRARVLQAAASLGYVDAASERPATLSCRFDVVLPAGRNSFLDMLADEIRQAAASFGDTVSMRLHRVEGFDPDALARSLDALGDSDGVAVVALDHPAVREAMRRLRGRGVPIATLVSDMAEIDSLGYVGIDNRASGRLAAQLLGRLIGPRAGRVVLFLGSRSYRGHEEREIGFRYVLEDDFAALTILAVRDTRDNDEATCAEATRLLAQHGDVVGIYNIAGGVRGIGRALEEAGAASRVVFVAHELTTDARAMLTAGVMDVAIDQDPAREAREVLRLLLAGARGVGRIATRQIRITPYFRENLP